MSARECLKPWAGKRLKVRGFVRAFPNLRDAALLDEVEVDLDDKWVLIGHSWVQKAEQFRFIDLRVNDSVEFTATVDVKVFPNDTKIGFRWPRHIRRLKRHEEPTGAKDVAMTIQTYNLLRSAQRKTEGEKRFAEVNGRWRRVIFVN